jgi:hypothetical protein
MSTLPKSIQDREYEKFDLNDAGEVVVRTTLSGEVSGEFSPSGLKISGKVTEVVLSDTAWTALPPVPLTNRNAINIQNYSGTQIKLNFDPSITGYVGIIVNDQSERNYDIKDSILIYAKAELGNPVIIIEEVS